MQKGTSQGLSLSIISTTIMLPTIIEQLFPSLLPTMLDRDVSKAVISLTRYVYSPFAGTCSIVFRQILLQNNVDFSYSCPFISFNDMQFMHRKKPKYLFVNTFTKYITSCMILKCRLC